MAKQQNIVATLMRQFDVEAKDVYFAMLISKGLSNGEAFTAIYEPLKPNAAAMANRHIRENPGINSLITYLNAEEKKPSTPGDESEDLEKYKSKDQMILELSKSLKGTNGKERADILMKIADLQRMKQEETKEAEERVHFYLPLPICKNCEYKNNLARKNINQARETKTTQTENK